MPQQGCSLFENFLYSCASLKMAEEKSTEKNL